MTAPRLLLVANVALLPGVALAQQAFDGAWCAEDNGAQMFLEGGRVGFNEQTICDPDPAIEVGLATAWRGTATCRTVHVLGRKADGTLETRETPVPAMTLRIAARGIDRVAVSFDQKPPKHYARCGE